VGEVGGVAERREDGGGGVRPQPLHEIHARGGGVSLLVHHHIHGVAEPNRTARDGSEQVGRHGSVISTFDPETRKKNSDHQFVYPNKKMLKKETLADSARWIFYCQTPKNLLFRRNSIYSLHQNSFLKKIYQPLYVA
jgi:hypothetical protein